MEDSEPDLISISRTPARTPSRTPGRTPSKTPSKTPNRSRASSIFYGLRRHNSQEEEDNKNREKGSFSIVEISISARNLEDRDTFSKSDPMCVVYHRPPGSKVWVEFGRTEMISNDLNPDFEWKVMMDYYFERTQPLRFQMYDMDSPNGVVEPDDSLGFIDLNLGQIVQASAAGLTIELSGQKNVNDTDKPPATIILIAEELAGAKDEVTLKLGGNSIGSFEFGCIPPKTFYVVSKLASNDLGTYLVVHRTRAKRSKGLNPIWPQLKISSCALCNGDMDRELRIEIFQRTFAGTVIPCGSTLVTLSKLMSPNSKDKIQLMTEKGEMSKSSIRVLSCTSSPVNTFIEYLQSGMEIQCCFSIDFTCSNGNPEDAQSLHYMSPQANNPNVYEQAIQAVGNIVQDYDTSSLFPAWGFGARLPPYGDISHNFPVNLTDTPNCTSVAGVLEAYRECVPKIQLYGATNFAPVIKIVSDMASKSKNGQNYYILVIITDGVITDMELTKKALVEASGYPLSVIIIGVGEMNFDAMEELDGDSVRISYKGKRAERDIVQFVAYRSARVWMQNTGEATLPNQEEKVTVVAPTDETEEKKPPTPPKIETAEEKLERAQRVLAQSQLAQEVLQEIPRQVCSYMNSKSITPGLIKKPPKKLAAMTNVILAGTKGPFKI